MSKVDKSTLIGVNIDAPIICVKHQDLKRQSEDSPYRSWCPTCGEGVLSQCKFGEHANSIDVDYCMLCGQQVKYTDLGALKGLRGG